MNKLIKYTRSYFFCDTCDKCYIYKGSYDKHKKNCIDTDIDITMNNDDIDNNMDNNNIIIDRYNYDLNSSYKINKFTLEILCPIYLFFVALIFGFIKGLCIGF